MDNTSPVTLIRMHYYEPRSISTVSQNVYLQEQALCHNKPVPDKIRRSIFGQKWILEINRIEDDDKNKCRWNVLVILVVASCFVLAVLCGAYFSTHNSGILKNMTIEESTNISSIDIIKTIWNLNANKKVATTIFHKINQQKIDHGVYNVTSPFEYCQNCIRPKNVCLKLTPDGPPTCEVSRDVADLTGCGGYCIINTQYCKLLDKDHLVYECLKDYTLLECLDGGYNCGNICISDNKICDGYIHCQDKSDELNCDCDLNNHFRCGGNVSCFDNFKKCDGRVDCWDASDEIGCASDYCISTEVACINGGCIHLDIFCDGVPDCQDKSDEPLGCELNYNAKNR